MKLFSWIASNTSESSLPWNFGKCRDIYISVLFSPLWNSVKCRVIFISVQFTIATMFNRADNNSSSQFLPWNPKSQLPVLREILVFVLPIVERLTAAVGHLGYITPWNPESKAPVYCEIQLLLEQKNFTISALWQLKREGLTNWPWWGLGKDEITLTEVHKSINIW